jgi:broad specificity phosphatase PhoE
MVAVYLIRHGQASFGKADYDQLSDKGSEQSRLLGKYWQSMSAPDKMYAGDLLRHGQTQEAFLLGLAGEGLKGDCLKGNSANSIGVILDSGFNELNHVDILSCYDSQWKNFAQMCDSIAGQPQANKLFQQAFVSAVMRWVSGEYDDEYKENWSQFKKRCVGALHNAINQAQSTQPSQEVCIFTSGGPIAVIVQAILGLSDQKTLMIIQQLRNTGVTKLHFSQDTLSVDYLNNYSHLTLAGADWVTYR